MKAANCASVEALETGRAALSHRARPPGATTGRQGTDDPDRRRARPRTRRGRTGLELGQIEDNITEFQRQLDELGEQRRELDELRSARARPPERTRTNRRRRRNRLSGRGRQSHRPRTGQGRLPAAIAGLVGRSRSSAPKATAPFSHAPATSSQSSPAAPPSPATGSLASPQASTTMVTPSSSAAARTATRSPSAR